MVRSRVGCWFAAGWVVGSQPGGLLVRSRVGCWFAAGWVVGSRPGRLLDRGQGWIVWKMNETKISKPVSINVSMIV